MHNLVPHVLIAHSSASAEALDDLHQARCVPRVLLCFRRQGRVREEFLLHGVLEDGPADCDADGLPEGAEEGEHSDGEGEVAVRGGGLDRKRHAGEEHAGAEARDKVQENPAYGGGVHVEEVEQTCACEGEHPAGPDRPAVAAGEGDEDADDDGGGGDGESLREEGEAGVYGGEGFDGFVIEGEVEEEGPEDHAMDDGAEVVDYCGAILEDCKWNEGFDRDMGFIEDEAGEAEDAEEKGYESVP